MTKVVIQDYANVRNRNVCGPDVVPKDTVSKTRGTASHGNYHLNGCKTYGLTGWRSSTPYK